MGKTDEVLIGSRGQTNQKRKEAPTKPSHQQAQFQSEMFNTKDDTKANKLQNRKLNLRPLTDLINNEIEEIQSILKDFIYNQEEMEEMLITKNFVADCFIEVED